MKNIISTVLFMLIVSMLFVKTQSTDIDSAIDKRLTWIQTLLSEDVKSIDSDNYIFYCTGHHGIIWSLITSDSSEVRIYNGTTRNHIDYTNQVIPDTLSFVGNNIKTISWGFDSLANAAHLLVPIENRVYNPIYNELYIIKDGNLSFCYNDAEVFYHESDSIEFNNKLSRLGFLMFWLAAPSCRHFLPLPNDTLSLR